MRVCRIRLTAASRQPLTASLFLLKIKTFIAGPSSSTQRSKNTPKCIPTNTPTMQITGFQKMRQSHAWSCSNSPTAGKSAEHPDGLGQTNSYHTATNHRQAEVRHITSGSVYDGKKRNRRLILTVKSTDALTFDLHTECSAFNAHQAKRCRWWLPHVAHVFFTEDRSPRGLFSFVVDDKPWKKAGHEDN